MHPAGPGQGGDPLSAPDPLVEFRLERVEDAILRLTTTTEQLARIEERHVETRAALERAFAAIKEQGQRISAMEQQMPGLNRAANWVYVAVAAVVGAAFMLVWRGTTHPAKPAPTVDPVAIVQRSEGDRR